jgi:hypothetical protein
MCPSGGMSGLLAQSESVLCTGFRDRLEAQSSYLVVSNREPAENQLRYNYIHIDLLLLDDGMMYGVARCLGPHE